MPGRGVAAYLDGDAIIAVARETGAGAIHPGYGFLSENADFARRCAKAGLTFVGPSPDTLARFGDKHAARKLATELGVPTLPGTAAPTTVAEARAFLRRLGPDGAVMVKAVAGGGGRGMRPVLSESALEEAFARCRSEAQSGFGNGDLFVERLIRTARHIEVQVIGDGRAVSHLWERDCSLQRRRQKVVEIAPAPGLGAELRDRLIDDALKLAGAAHYLNLGTIEFLVDANSGEHFFIEANPRLQVEHTVTEEITGLNLVELQLRLAGGATLAELGLARERVPKPRGMALQARINLESIAADGTVKPGGGTLTTFETPSGRGIRVDSSGYVGYRTSPAYDPLLAKLIVHTGSERLEDVLTKGYRALCEMHVAGAPTNIAFLQALLTDAERACRGRRSPISSRRMLRPLPRVPASSARISTSRLPGSKPRPGPEPRSMPSIRWLCWPTGRRGNRLTPASRRPRRNCPMACWRSGRRCRARSYRWPSRTAPPFAVARSSP